MGCHREQKMTKRCRNNWDGNRDRIQNPAVVFSGEITYNNVC